MMPVLEAAQLILADYEGRLSVDPGARLDINGCQSVVVEYADVTVLLIRGSDEKLDWLRNIRFLPTFGVDQGDECWWHGGFLAHARIAYGWARDKGVDLVIGHSLGAAAAQIVAPSMGVPAIGFASPRPLFAPATRSPRPARGDLVVNYLRADDWITDLPPLLLGFQHVGATKIYTPTTGRHFGEDHRIGHYIDVLEQFI